MGFANAALANASGPNADHELIESLIRNVEQVLDPLVPREGGVALVDFPRTANVGDSVIWLGTLAWLVRSGRGLPRHVCSERSYEPRVMAKRLGGGTILLSGGGNFGDLYPNHQHLRERVIADFPDARIVQMPQTIHFQGTEALTRARAALDRHPRLTLLVRDRPSLEIARAEFRAPSLLCPDMGVCMGMLRRPAATAPIAWLSRRDREAPAEAPDKSPDLSFVGVEREDWLTEDMRITIRINSRIGHLMEQHPALRSAFAPWLGVLFERVARLRVERGMRILGRGKVAVTNRLHGHLLALLMGIPHYVVDNSYGKVSAFHDAWTRESKLAHFCETQAEALALAARASTNTR